MLMGIQHYIYGLRNGDSIVDSNDEVNLRNIKTRCSSLPYIINVLQFYHIMDCLEAAIHCNSTLTGMQKLNYLQAQLQCRLD